MGRIHIQAHPAAAIRWQGGRRGGRGGRRRGGGQWAEGKVALATFRVGGRLSSTSTSSASSASSVVCIRGGEGAAGLLARRAPLRVRTLPLAHLYGHRKTRLTHVEKHCGHAK